MQYWKDLGEVPADFGPSIVTIGNFDGVHRGHRQVITELVRQARERAVTAVVVTFDPHPATVHRPDAAPELIMGIEDRLRSLSDLGVDAALVMHYTRELSSLTAEQFVQDVFVDTLHACGVVVGHDVRWGRGNAGDRDLMERLGRERGFDVTVIEEYQFGTGDADDDVDAERRCSSTWIREALDAGDVRTAARILGRPHRVRGTVVHGAQRGRELGFPTANLAPEATGYVPADGVYSGWLFDEEGTRWPAAISVGSNPTFEGVDRQVEAHVIDRPKERVQDFDLYGQHVVVEFIDHLRSQVTYKGIEALIEQMHLDVDESRDSLNDAGSAKSDNADE